ncbi:MarR family winged helix-turn-helix transcriptional regulator [Gordonia jacobaea]|uniref:MarR family winged helix-turn-helix transcriptional regulator n=1 Tax=Gordonia jacobaea TaxID=122202 RepID=UPI003D7363C0
MTTSRLNDTELLHWQQWKRAADRVWSSTVDQITAETGLSGADFSVLTRVAESDGNRIQQARLAELLGWERSRLSRQISRMVDRGLLTRDVAQGVRTIGTTEAGQSQVVRARQAHSRAVRTHLFGRIEAKDADAFWRVIDSLTRE